MYKLTLLEKTHTKPQPKPAGPNSYVRTAHTSVLTTTQFCYQGSHASWKVLENGFGHGKSWKF